MNKIIFGIKIFRKNTFVFRGERIRTSKISQNKFKEKKKRESGIGKDFTIL